MNDELFEQIKRAQGAGAVIVIKFDGERTDLTGTVIITDPRWGFQFRRDSDQLLSAISEGLGAFWTSRDGGQEVVRGHEDQFRSVFGSDVPNDGCYLELRNANDQVVACVFRSDATGEFSVDVGPTTAPSEVVSRFIETAKKDLLNRVASN